jgi:hypothetical protein
MSHEDACTFSQIVHEIVNGVFACEVWGGPITNSLQPLVIFALFPGINDGHSNFLLGGIHAKGHGMLAARTSGAKDGDQHCTSVIHRGNHPLSDM